MKFIGKLVRVFRRIAAPTLLVCSLMLNIGLFFSSSVFDLAASAAESLTGRRTVVARQADEIANLSADLDEERRLRREAQSELTEANASLLAERQAKRQLRSELTDAGELLAASAASRKKIQGAVMNVAEEVSERAARTATREVASMPGEAIPFWGTAVIAGATALELKDLCQTMIDMTELQQLFNPSAVPPEDQLTVCSLEVPSRAEIWEAAASAPGSAWEAAKGAVPDLDDVRSFEFGDIDWIGLGQSISDSAEGMAASTANAVQRKWAQFKKWQE